MKIAVTGATGFVGQRLVQKLASAGHSVNVLTRSTAKAQRLFPKGTFPGVEAIDITDSGAYTSGLSGCDGIVNLAGEPIAEKRWSDSQKQEILHSRVKTTQALVETIAQMNPKPSVMVSASAIGFYGTSETASFDESSPSGSDFLAQVCREWEAAAQPVTESGVRLVITRIGIVLGDGGALGKMLPAFKAFAGGPIGSGAQWFSWIYREDLVNLLIQALTDEQMSGVYNATSPNPVRMNQLAAALGEVMGRPSWLPVPGFALEVLLGEGAQVVLEGQQVLPQRTQDCFQYDYPQLETALQDFL